MRMENEMYLSIPVPRISTFMTWMGTSNVILFTSWVTSLSAEQLNCVL